MVTAFCLTFAKDKVINKERYAKTTTCKKLERDKELRGTV